MRFERIQVVLMIALMCFCANGAHAQFSIPWSSIDGGCGTSSGGSFTLSGTIGQWDAGATMSGGAFTLTGGLWAGSSEPVNSCLADYNDDGAVDGDDVIAFFADWDFGDLAADVSRDGGVDGDDVILFFERWDAGC